MGKIDTIKLVAHNPLKFWELVVSGIFGSGGENGAKKLENWFKVCLRYI